MNNYLKSTVLTLTAAAVLTGCTASSRQPAGTAAADAGVSGEFESTVKGRNADLTVRTTFENSVIIKVEVTDHQETIGAADGALEGVPAAIVENNSVAVDTVSGAAITFEAIKEAVSNAITEAGLNPDDYRKASEKQETSAEAEKLTADVVVGAGGAGVSSALTASERCHNYQKKGVSECTGTSSFCQWMDLARNSLVRSEEGSVNSFSGVPCSSMTP